MISKSDDESIASDPGRRAFEGGAGTTPIGVALHFLSVAILIVHMIVVGPSIARGVYWHL